MPTDWPDVARSAARTLSRLPRWSVLRLATISGVSVGWWVMALVSGAVGALSAVATVTVVHLYLKGSRKGALPIASSSVAAGRDVGIYRAAGRPGEQAKDDSNR